MKPDMTIKMGPPSFKDIALLDKGKKIDEQEIILLCDYIKARYDCADFRMVAILRTLYSYKHLLSQKTLDYMKDTILSFKYWMDEPGEDNMCYWSENHQILFHAIEYLAGQYYPHEIFSNDGKSGKNHMGKAYTKIMRWLYYRFTYGFTEWHSNVYYEEDIAPLSLLIDFSQNEEMVLKSKMIMDIILMDLAIFSWKGLFSASSGRCYKEQKMHPNKQPTLQITEKLFGFNNIEEFDYGKMSADFLLNKKYDLPDIIPLIGKDTKEQIAKDSMGLDLKEIKYEFDDLEDIDTTGMFLWTMEAFTNKESIHMALKVINEWNLHKNAFLQDFKMINIKILIKLRLLPLVVRILNPITQGIAIQRANTYLYKNDYYTLSTAMAHHIKEFADQQHIWQATLSKDVSVFTTHPGSPAFSDIDRNFSPDYWVGSGILPHCVQDKNVHISIYDLSARKGFMEKKRLLFTHAYFPQDEFDRIYHDNNYIFGQVKDSYIALIGRNPLGFNKDDKNDLIQEGKLTYWIAILGDKKKDKSFETFIEKVKAKEITFKRKVLSIKGEKEYLLKYKKDFYVDNLKIDYQHKRLESTYGRIERKPKEMEFKFKDHYLYLNFEKSIRKFGKLGD